MAWHGINIYLGGEGTFSFAAAAAAFPHTFVRAAGPYPPNYFSIMRLLKENQCFENKHACRPFPALTVAQQQLPALLGKGEERRTHHW